MGTVGYMAPEQVRGVSADHRADVFAFGAILYEMLAGRRAFRGDTAMDTMSAILKEDPPDLAGTDRPIAPGLQRIVSRCLEKNPAARFQSTRDLAFALEGMSAQSESTSSARGETAHRSVPAVARTRERVVAALAVLFLLTTLGLAAWALRPTSAPAVVAFPIPAPETTTWTSADGRAAFALSPDGRRLAFTAAPSGAAPMIYIRALDAIPAMPMAGTEGARNPFWSPDSRAVGFFADSKLKSIDLSTGAVRTICDAVGQRAWGDWGADGVMVFSTENTNPIQRVSVDGGQPVAITKVSGRDGHLRPTLLPDNRHFLYLVVTRAGNELRWASIDGADDVLVAKPSGWGRYIDPGYLVYVRGQEVIAQRFDAADGRLTGPALTLGTVGTGFSSSANTTASGFSITSNILAFQSVEQATDFELVWFDRSGKRLSVIGESGAYRNLHLSPDGSRLAVQQSEPQIGRTDVWMVDLVRGVKTRVTVDTGNHGMPVWSPDGSSLFTREGAGPGARIIRWPITISGRDEEVIAADIDPNSFAPDGRHLVYTTLNAATNRDVGILPLNGDRKPLLLFQSAANETHGQVSPDGKWIAYESDESGSTEVYIQGFPTPGQKTRVSTAGGMQPRWRRDSSELFYVASDRRLMSVALRTAPQLRVEPPIPLFETRIVQTGGVGTNAHYDVSADGERFIVASLLGAVGNPAITVVVNWLAALPQDD